MKLKSLNKKGMSIIGKLLLAILIIGVIIAVVIIPIRNRLIDLGTLTTNFTPIEKDFSDSFPFIANNLSIVSTGSDIPCTIINDDEKPKVPNEWNCDANKDVIFYSDITYYGTKLRTFHAGILVCEEDDETCCDKLKTSPTNVAWSAAPFKIIPNDKTLCSSGIYNFQDSKTYKVIPVAECVFDSKIGCKVPGMTQSVKSCNPNNYILIHVN